MKLVDTHTHLYVKKFEADRQAVIDLALARGVERFYLPSIDQRHFSAMLQMEADYPGRCFAMMGLHPCSVGEGYQEELAAVKEMLDRRPFAAVGEIGVDLYWDKTYFEQQKEAFLTQIEWAKSLGLPIVIHSREATDIIIELLQGVKDDRLRGIFHCFTGTVEQAQAIIDLEFYLGIGGIVTFKNAGLDKTLAQIDLERMVLETDSPYLAPAPYRGKRNESAYIFEIAQKVAELKGCSMEEVAEQTTRNAEAIFVQRGTKVKYT